LYEVLIFLLYFNLPGLSNFQTKVDNDNGNFVGRKTLFPAFISSVAQKNVSKGSCTETFIPGI